MEEPLTLRGPGWRSFPARFRVVGKSAEGRAAALAVEGVQQGGGERVLRSAVALAPVGGDGDDPLVIDEHRAGREQHGRRGLVDVFRAPRGGHGVVRVDVQRAGRAALLRSPRARSDHAIPSTT
ncbi:hypothetical protein [Streptomyces triticiradicis]|uniref:Uncharacterized protein n=1 Tax=Streptomyces triticiradicis TaxID=2651189 RepID=A0A7J5DNB3_9ACTN|nr:hypothetical protein [Streptomyces triticiradicis]KAB1990241.1 hypothetical protein F8144_04140 [Streptomyces triticiradicis]